MKALEVFRFEIGYQARRLWPWLFAAVLFVFAFLMTRDGSLAEALHDDFFLNSPFAIAKTTVAGSLIWLLVAAAVAGEAASRDQATGMHPLTYTTPIGKAEHLGGRFAAALVLNASILLAVQAGILVAVYLPGVDGALVGPFRPAAYLTAYGFLALPNALAATAIQFSLATWSGRPMAGFLGSIVLFFMSYVVGLFLLFQGRQDLANLLDPIGVHFILSELSHLWTPFEKSWRLVALEGTVLHNRLIWSGVALGALAVTFARFRFAHRTQGAWRKRRTRRPAVDAPAVDPGPARPTSHLLVPPSRRAFGVAIGARQTLAVAWASLRAIATSWGGFALLAAIPMLTVLVVLDQMEVNGVPLIPATAQVIGELTGQLSADPLAGEPNRWVIIPLLVVYFAGELVWRERDAGLGELADATPRADWVPLLGKCLGLGGVLALFMAMLTGAGVLAQAVLGHRHFELGLYLKVLFGLQLPEYLLYAVLAMVLHTLFDQKYAGHVASVVALVFMAMASLVGVEHRLLIFGASPGWSYTEMRGFGPSVWPWLWFKLYWAAWALLLAVAARLLWVRGTERGLRARLRLARSRFTGPTAWIAASAACLAVSLGGFIFYNTNVLNRYRDSSQRAERRAEYERRYRRYEGILQPRVAGTRLRVEIYPANRAVAVRGTYELVNRGSSPIGTVHVATVPGEVTGAMAFDRSVVPALEDEEFGHRIYALDEPLLPGESLRLTFEVRREARGFENGGIDASVTANGSFLTNRDWLPAIGYQRERELTSASDRRAHGLPPRPLVASLNDVETRPGMTGHGGTAFEAVVGTDAHQIAVAPGALRRTWMEGGRRYFHYATDAPIGSEYAVSSAAYEVREQAWTDPRNPGHEVAIRIFHHPGHTANLDRMVRSVRASLDYYGEQFGPYPYGHISLVEHPGNGTGLHAEPSMLSYSEGFARWNPGDDRSRLDFPFAVVAHEMAHQWTVSYAYAEGAPLLSEGLAWYSAMQVVKAARGDAELRRLLTFMRQPYPYPPIRRGEPLLRALDPYLAYRKGPFAMYALSEYIGADRVNAAIRRLVERDRAGASPPATTLDLYRELQAVTPASLHYLLHDLFEVNTFWDLEAERAAAVETAAGTWQVTVEVRARKVVFDSAGVETEAPVDDWVQVGVFAAGDQGGRQPGPALGVQLHRIRAGRQTIALTVPRRPALAGIDPYHLLADLDSDDNLTKVGTVR